MEQETQLDKSLVYVIWKDAVSVDPWTDFEDIEPTFHTIETCGFAICETPDVLTIALNHDTDSNNYSCFLHLPKVMIMSRTEIKCVLNKAMA